MGFGLRGIWRIAVGVDGADLVRREGLVPACLELPGQVERLVGVLQGLIVASLQPTDFAEPCDLVCLT